MAGITSGARGGAERRAFRLGSMAVASTRGGKRVSSHRWPLAEVERGGEVRRRGLPARKKTKAAARRPGGRGSSGSRHSRRVWLLPRAASVFAAYGSTVGGSSPPLLLLLHPLLLRRTVWAVKGGSPGAARVWGSLPGSAAALNRAARLGTHGWPGYAGGRGARHDGEARGRRAAFALGVSQSAR
jgi:hypothetical protein